MKSIVQRGKSLSLSQKFSRLAKRLRDPEWRRYGATLAGRQSDGRGFNVALHGRCYRHLLHEGSGGRHSGESSRHRQPGQHRMDADCRVSRLRHAGRLHDAGSRLLPLARNRQRADGMHRRHLPLRHSLLRHRLRIHVQPWQRLHRLSLVLPAGRAGDLRDNRRRLPRGLDLPVRLCRHLLHHYFRRDDRPHGLRRRPALLAGCLRLHLSDHRPLGMGSGRLSGHHGRAGILPAHPGDRASTTSPVPRWCTPSADLSLWPVRIVLGPRLGRKFKRDGGGPCCRTI